MTDPDPTPTLVLPDRATLDPISAAALAVMGELDVQLADSPDGLSVVLDPQAIARAALAAIEGLPRIPAWIDEDREVGGGRVPGDPDAQPLVVVRTSTAHPGRIELDVQQTCDHGQNTYGVAAVPAADAEQWFLAGLAACAAARATQDPTPG